MQIDDLPPLRDIIATHGLDAKKSLGQNFLLDLNLTSKIARLAGDISGHDVLEVGPGPGGLTRGLLAAGARRVVALEKDPRCMPALAQISAAYPGRLDVFNADALEFDMRGQLTGPVRVVANLPYNVGTELLVRWLTPKGVATILEQFDFDVSKRSGRADHCQARHKGLRTTWYFGPMEEHTLCGDGAAAGSFHTATESPFGRRASRSLSRATFSSPSRTFVFHRCDGIQSAP